MVPSPFGSGCNMVPSPFGRACEHGPLSLWERVQHGPLSLWESVRHGPLSLWESVQHGPLSLWERVRVRAGSVSPPTGNHPRHARRREHHDEAHRIGPRQVADLDHRGPVELRVAQVAHRDPRQQMGAGEFQPGPDDRRRHDHRDPQAVDRRAAKPDERGQIEPLVESHGEPAETGGPMRKHEPPKGRHPEEEPGQPQGPIGSSPRQLFAADQEDPRDRRDPAQRPPIQRRQRHPKQDRAGNRPGERMKDERGTMNARHGCPGFIVHPTSFPPSSRNRFKSVGPRSVRKLSGWNWRP